ncbi:hypothetical protein BVY03_03100 [bacterium K02(2017)]|nr:hypothetical protein BVY03_03100 [bacterium K02(2017)]
MTYFEPRPFGKYFLTDLIAIGGMAEIYKAKTFGVDGFEKVLAIKKILSHYSSDKDFIVMLTDEAKLVVNLSHANIVQVYDLGRVGDDYFISMEHIDGINLKDLIERAKELDEKIPPEICAYIISEVCKGLDYAHHKKDTEGLPLKIVHRDISPQNILVSFDGSIKIVDFGIAKAAMNLSQTQFGTLKGKVTYMSPEQAFGKPIDGRTDLYSLGIILYELLTQKRFFVGESQMEILKKIRQTKVSLESLDESILDIYKPLLVKSLAHSVKERYQSAADMQIDFTRLLYSHFSNFSPKTLSTLLHDWFLNESKFKKKKKDAFVKKDEQKILVSSSASQKNDSESLKPQPNAQLQNLSNSQNLTIDVAPSDINIQLEETLESDDGIDKEMFETQDDIGESVEKAVDEDFENTEKTEKSEVLKGIETVEELLDKKSKGSNVGTKVMILFAIIFLFFVIYLMFEGQLGFSLLDDFKDYNFVSLNKYILHSC